MSRFEADLGSTVRPVENAALARSGVEPHVLRTSRWDRTSRGLYVPGGTDRTAAQRIVSAAALVPPEGVLGGWAAGHVHGVDLLDGLRPDGTELPVLVLLDGADLHRAEVPGVSYRRASLAPEDCVRVHGIPVTTPLRTAVDLACWARTLEEAVVHLDLLLGTGLSTHDLYRHLPKRRRGAVRAREAIALARRGSRSPGESRLRVVYVRDVGGSDPLLNPTLLDTGGGFVAMPDVFDPGAGLAMEYDGASWDDDRDHGHRDKRQHREDNVREEAMERLGVIVVRADAADLGPHRHQLAYRLQRARMDGLGRDRRRDRWVLRPQLAGER